MDIISLSLMYIIYKFKIKICSRQVWDYNNVCVLNDWIVKKKIWSKKAHHSSIIKVLLVSTLLMILYFYWSSEVRLKPCR